jgi:CheY-like chemotaxis protein
VALSEDGRVARELLRREPELLLLDIAMSATDAC